MQTVQYSSRQASDHHSLTRHHHPLSSDLDIDKIIASAYMKNGVDGKSSVFVGAVPRVCSSGSVAGLVNLLSASRVLQVVLSMMS